MHGKNLKTIQGISTELEDLYDVTGTYYCSPEKIGEVNVIPCKQRLHFRDAYACYENLISSFELNTHNGLYKLNTFGEINNSELQCLLWLATLEKVSNLKGSFIAAFGRGRNNLSKHMFMSLISINFTFKKILQGMFFAVQR